MILQLLWGKLIQSECKNIQKTRIVVFLFSISKESNEKVKKMHLLLHNSKKCRTFATKKLWDYWMIIQA